MRSTGSLCICERCGLGSQRSFGRIGHETGDGLRACSERIFKCANLSEIQRDGAHAVDAVG